MTEPAYVWNKDRIWVRLINMLIVGVLVHIATALMWFLFIAQFILTIVKGQENTKLASFGAALGEFFRQAFAFLSFASDDKPFPFSDWPSQPHPEESGSEQDLAPPADQVPNN